VETISFLTPLTKFSELICEKGMNKNSKEIWIQFLFFVKPLWKHKLTLFLLMLTASAASLSLPFLFKIVIDEVLVPRQSGKLYPLVFLLLLIYGARTAIRYSSDYLYTWISSNIVVALTREVYKKIITLPLDYFRRNGPGEIIQRIGNEVSQVQGALAGSVIVWLNSLITIVILVVMLAYLNWKLFLAIIWIYPLVIILVRTIRPKIVARESIVHELEANIFGYVFDRVSRIKVVKTSNAYRAEDENMSNRLKQLLDNNLISGKYSSGSKSLSMLLLAFGPIIVIGWGGSMVIESSITLGTLVAFLQYTNKLHEPAQELVGQYIQLMKTTVSLRRIFDILSETSEARDSGIVLRQRISKIEIEGLSKRFDDVDVLKNVSVTLDLGKVYAIQGKNGAGKSTFVNILTKLDVYEGVVRVNGVDLKDLDTDFWRSRISVIHQSTLVFDGTVRENIFYGLSGGIQKENLEKLNCVLADLGENLRWDMESTTNVLSGGQKQQVAFLRALMADPDVIIIDEGTSEIDSGLEKSFLAKIRELAVSKIVVLITHNSTALEFVDEVICLREGAIAEICSPKQLVVSAVP